MYMFYIGEQCMIYKYMYIGEHGMIYTYMYMFYKTALFNIV